MASFVEVRDVEDENSDPQNVTGESDDLDEVATEVRYDNSDSESVIKFKNSRRESVIKFKKDESVIKFKKDSTERTVFGLFSALYYKYVIYRDGSNVISTYLLLNIFSKFSFEQNLETAQVCQLWKDVVYHTSMWRNKIRIYNTIVAKGTSVL